MPTGISIVTNAEGAINILQRIHDTAQNPIPAQKEVATYLENRQPVHIQLQRDENNMPWTPLSPVTIAIKTAKGFSLEPLVRSGRMKGEISSWYSRDEIGVGSAFARAVRHQLGDNVAMQYMANLKGKIPARPFIYMTDDEGDTVIEIYKKHLEKALAAPDIIGGQQ